MRIRIDYTTRYDYALPASHVVQLLRVQPRATEDQHILSWRLEVDADGSLRGNTDDKLLVRGRENIRLGMAEQQAAENFT